MRGRTNPVPERRLERLDCIQQYYHCPRKDQKYPNARSGWSAVEVARPGPSEIGFSIVIILSDGLVRLIVYVEDPLRTMMSDVVFRGLPEHFSN